MNEPETTPPSDSNHFRDGTARFAGVSLIMAVLVVSEMELSRIDILQRIVDRGLTCTAAKQLLGLSQRQVYRLVSAYRTQGAPALVSKRRGKPSNRRYPAALRDKVLELVREHYHDVGPTFAAEKLAEHHGVRISRETLRKWMIQAGLSGFGRRSSQAHRVRVDACGSSKEDQR